MRGTFSTGFLATLATASFLLTGSSAHQAEAAMLAPASIPHNSDAALIQRVVNVCGSNGCVRVETQRVVHHKPGSVAAKHI
jgi:hypothetical protein